MVIKPGGGGGGGGGVGGGGGGGGGELGIIIMHAGVSSFTLPWESCMV